MFRWQVRRGARRTATMLTTGCCVCCCCTKCGPLPARNESEAVVMAAIMVCTPDDEDEREVARDGKSNDWKVARKKRSPLARCLSLFDSHRERLSTYEPWSPCVLTDRMVSSLHSWASQRIIRLNSAPKKQLLKSNCLWSLSPRLKPSLTKLVCVAGGRPRPGPIQAPSSSFKLRQSEYAGEQRYQREKCKYCHVRPSIVRVDAQGRPSSSCSSYRESKRTTGARRASERRARDRAVIHKQMIDDGRR